MVRSAVVVHFNLTFSSSASLYNVARTTFGLKVRRVRRLEKLTLLPNPVALPANNPRRALPILFTAAGSLARVFRGRGPRVAAEASRVVQIVAMPVQRLRLKKIKCVKKK